MDAEPAYDAFLSYASRPDRALARRLESWLETWHEAMPEGQRKTPLRVCRDGSDFKLSERHPRRAGETEVQATLRTYLCRSTHLIVLCSSGSVASTHVDDEIRIFLECAPKEARTAADRVIVVVTEGDDPMARPREVFPSGIVDLRLHERVWVDLRGVSRRRRRNAQGVRDFDEERLTLAARLHGESVDAISPAWYREQRSRARRQLAAGGLALAIVSALALGMLIFWRRSVERERETRDTLRVALAERHQPHDLELAAAYLLEVEAPERTARWGERAQELLRAPVADALWRHDKLQLVGSIERHGNTVLAYSLDGSRHVFPPGTTRGCAVGFSSDALGTLLAAPSSSVAWGQRGDRLFRLTTSCVRGDRDEETVLDSRPLVGVWGSLPILAASAHHFVAADLIGAEAPAVEWRLPFECVSSSAPLILDDQVVMLCRDGRVVMLGDDGRVEAPEVPAACRGDVGAAATNDSGILFAVAENACNVAAASRSVRRVATLPAPVRALAANPAGTVAAVVEAGATHRLWVESGRLELAAAPADGALLAVDPDGGMAAVSRGRLRWTSADGGLELDRPLPDVHVHDASFLPDGRLVVALDDGTLRVWNGSTLKSRARLTRAGQVLHVRAGPRGVEALYRIDARFACVTHRDASVRWLDPGSDGLDAPARAGWLIADCATNRTQRCWFDALGDEAAALPLGEVPLGKVPLGEGVRRPDLADAVPGWLAWYSEGRLSVADLVKKRVVATALEEPAEVPDSLTVLADGRVALSFTDSRAEPTVVFVVRTRWAGAELVVDAAERRPSTRAIGRIDAREDVLCEFRRDGWVVCDRPELRFQLPEGAVTTPGGQTWARMQRDPRGIARVDERRYLVWSSDRACVFGVGDPERCHALGYTGINIDQVAIADGAAMIGTLEGTVYFYDLDSDRDPLVPTTTWDVGDRLDAMRVAESTLLLGTSAGILELPRTPARLRAALSERSGVCVVPGRRVLELGEDAESAARRHEECLDPKKR